jgi:hypothetical protein
MIIDLAASKTFVPDKKNNIVIVGAGPVAIYLAHCLPRRRIRCLIEAGGRVADITRNQVATSSVGLEFVGHRLGRAFGLGGTSVIWGGQLAEFDAPDFSRSEGFEPDLEDN